MLQETVGIVLPIFAMIAFGFLIAGTKILSQDVGDALSSFCVTILLPVLIFRTLANADLTSVNPLPLWGGYYSALFTVYAIAYFTVRYAFGREARAGVIGGITASFGNAGLMGIPLITFLFGEKALLPLSLIISIHLALVTVVSVVLMERAVVVDGYRKARPLPQVLLSVFRSLYSNPIIVGIFLGVLWNLSGLHFPEIAERVMGPMAKAATPVALIAIGMSLMKYGIRGTLAIGCVLSVFKVVLLPALVFFMTSQVIVLDPFWVGVATITAACPTGVNAFLLATQFGTGHAMSANGITITTFASIFSAAAWYAILMSLGY
ncbi:AEC family transporter [Rhodobacteraceae bacterium RKSG542]|uniref:AEC family transporter n=1 Tax=Pseudovibrio flavus TaxID=2529854 RepID=UPI0012BBD46A|nr:AEC family transporter [Pseudovibrio flavus]MTI18384.1 AEC family transporter [Pseudovibrio flavus]